MSVYSFMPTTAGLGVTADRFQVIRGLDSFSHVWKALGLCAEIQSPNPKLLKPQAVELNRGMHHFWASLQTLDLAMTLANAALELGTSRKHICLLPVSLHVPLQEHRTALWVANYRDSLAIRHPAAPYNRGLGSFIAQLE